MHLCQGLFFKKFAGLGPATLLKKRLWYRCFPVNFKKVLRINFLHIDLCYKNYRIGKYISSIESEITLQNCHNKIYVMGEKK